MANNVFIINERFSDNKSLLKAEKKRRTDTLCEDDEKLENDIWLFLHNFGFTKLNIGRQCSIEFGPKISPFKKNIDVIAEDQKVRIFVECTIQKNNSSKIKDWIADKASISKYDGIADKNTVFVFFTNQRVNKEDFKKLNDAGIKLLTPEMLDYLSDLAGQYKKLAYYHLLGFLLENKQIVKGHGFIEVPAIKCKYSKENDCYLFGIQPAKLIPLANVIHRQKWLDPNQEDLGVKSYQRLVKKSKISKIKDFIKRERGVFPTNIIVSFKKTSGKIFDPKGPKIGNICYGILKLPMKYQYVTIIDGQHRLFAYDGLDVAETDLIYVVGFEDMDLDAQMKTFIDINKNQTKVSSSLLWDLYPDLLDDSSDDYKLRKTISLLAKGLNECENALYSHIEYDSAPPTKEPKITLESICTAISKNGIIKTMRSVLEELDVKEDNIEKYYKVLLIQYFNGIRDLNTELWDKKKSAENILCSNQGIGALIILFKKVFYYLHRKGILIKYSTVGFENLDSEFSVLLKPLVDYVGTLLTPEQIKELKPKGESGKVEIYKKFLQEINMVYPDFYPEEIAKTKVAELDELLNELKENDEGEIEAKEALFTNTIRSKIEGKLLENNSDDLNSIFKTVVAFMNSKNGGNILLGVENKTWNIKGLDETDVKLKKDTDGLKRAISDEIRNRVRYFVRAPEIIKYTKDNKTVIVIKVIPLPDDKFSEYTLAALDVKGHEITYIRENDESIELRAGRKNAWCNAILSERRDDRAKNIDE